MLISETVGCDGDCRAAPMVDSSADTAGGTGDERKASNRGIMEILMALLHYMDGDNLSGPGTGSNAVRNALHLFLAPRVIDTPALTYSGFILVKEGDMVS